MSRLSILLALASVALPAAARAQADPRLQRLPYVAGAVVTVRVIPGYVAAIALSPDERVESVAVGNAGAWEVTPNKAGDHLFVKPLAAGVATNVEVVTDTRAYSFLLQTTYEGDPQAAFRLDFDYRDAAPPPPPGQPMPPLPGAEARTAVVAAPIPAGYRLSGDRLARPVAVSDDGAATRFTFADTAAMPAIYAIDDQGHEALVTTRRDGDGWVIDRVWRRYVLRVGKARASVERVAGRAAR